MVPAGSSDTLAMVLPYRNDMSKTQGIQPIQLKYIDTRRTCFCATSIHWCGTSHWKLQLPVLISCVALTINSYKRI